VSSEIVLQNI